MKKYKDFTIKLSSRCQMFLQMSIWPSRNLALIGFILQYVSERKVQITKRVKFRTKLAQVYCFYTPFYIALRFFEIKNHLGKNFQGSVKNSDYQLKKMALLAQYCKRSARALLAMQARKELFCFQWLRECTTNHKNLIGSLKNSVKCDLRKFC